MLKSNNKLNVAFLQVVKSRTIWRDIERHADDHIDDDEVGNMAAVLNLYLLYGAYV